MKKIAISFGVGICLIVAGVTLGGIIDVSHFYVFKDFRWNASRVSDLYMEADLVDCLDVQVHNANVTIYEKENLDRIEIEASQIYSGFEVKQKGQQLKINQPHYRWFKDDSTAQVNIYVPTNYQFEEVNVELSAGEVHMYNVNAHHVNIDSAAGSFLIDQLTCDDLSLDASLGEMTLQNVSVCQQIDIDLGLGDVNMLLKGHESEYNYIVDVGLGNVVIGDNEFSGVADQKIQSARRQKMIDVDCGMGNVYIEMEEK